MNEAAPPVVSAHRALGNLAALAVVVAGLKLAAGLLVPISFALFLAVLSLPLFHGLLARRAPVSVAIFVTVVVLLAGVALFGLLLMISLGELREVAPVYAQTLQERIAYTDEWWQGHGIAIRDAGGRAIRMVGSTGDISELKRVEQELADSRERYELATKAATEGIQMHGGIGMTDEFDIGFFIKRAAVAEQTFGDVNFHRNRYGELEGY